MSITEVNTLKLMEDGALHPSKAGFEEADKHLHIGFGLWSICMLVARLIMSMLSAHLPELDKNRRKTGDEQLSRRGAWFGGRLEQFISSIVRDFEIR